MSEDNDIAKPIEAPGEKSTRKRSIFGRIFWGLVAVFIGFHLYALALKIIPVPGTILMVQRAIAGEDIKRNWTKLEDISPYLVSAVIAAEDSGFCSHEGIDWNAVQDAISDNQTRKRRRGGSTITQQTAKNVFLWNGGGFVRKIPETWMASFVDYVWGKKRVLEIYLNVAEWGDGLFGAEAAARERFNKSARDLSPREAALLASVLPSPNKWRLDPPGDYVQKRSRTVQARLYVVRNEGYADCVLGASKKRIGPAPKPKQKPQEEPATEIVKKPETEQELPAPEESDTDREITEEPLAPVSEEAEVTAPESEEDEGVEIKPE